MLNRHQAVKQLFLRYNTALSSSAPVERLFSSGSLILSKRQNRLSDKLFETLLLLKTNKQFTYQEQLIKFLTYVVYVDDNTELSVYSVICMANIICCSLL